MNVEQLVQDVIDGNENPLKAYALLKQRVKDLTAAIAHIEDAAMDEASKYGEKSFSDLGFSFELRDGTRRYSFANIPEWVDLNGRLKEREMLFKQAAVAYEKGNNMVDENGEIIPVPNVSYSKPCIVVKSRNND